LAQASGAAPLPLKYRGLIELDHGSSIVDIPRHSRYWVDFTLDGSIVDTQHTVFENGLVNANGVHGITALGSYLPPFLDLKFTADSSNGLSPLDLSGLNFAYMDAAGSGASVVDANQPPNPQADPCVDAPCHGEHVTLSIRDLTPGALHDNSSTVSSSYNLARHFSLWRPHIPWGGQNRIGGQADSRPPANLRVRRRLWFCSQAPIPNSVCEELRAFG
jgi:hypothetical protein